MSVTCPAHNAPKLGYIAWHADATERGRRRELQYRCRLCGLWQWGEHYTDPAAMGPTASMANKAERMRANLEKAA